MFEEKRRNVRKAVIDGSADLNDGLRVFSNCCIKDISVSGVMISDIPIKFIEANLNRGVAIPTIISLNGKFIRLNTAPRWIKKQSYNYVSAGFEIFSNASDWLDFMKVNTNFISAYGRTDVWGKNGVKYLRENCKHISV